MCGRVRLSTDHSEIRIQLRLPVQADPPNFGPLWNGAPTQTLPIVRRDDRTGARRLDLMRWGLIPYWAKDEKIGYRTINAVAETIDTKPAFRDAFARRRCLVPVDSFYEWKKVGTTKQPYALALANGLMTLAGLWETWRSPQGERIRTFTVITCPPNELCAELHDRMPVILPETAWPAWLGEEPASLEELKALLRPHPSETMRCWPVHPRVGDARNDDPACIEPIEITAAVRPGA